MFVRLRYSTAAAAHTGSRWPADRWTGCRVASQQQGLAISPRPDAPDNAAGSSPKSQLAHGSGFFCTAFSWPFSRFVAQRHNLQCDSRSVAGAEPSSTGDRETWARAQGKTFPRGGVWTEKIKRPRPLSPPAGCHAFNGTPANPRAAPATLQ